MKNTRSEKIDQPRFESSESSVSGDMTAKWRHGGKKGSYNNGTQQFKGKNLQKRSKIKKPDWGGETIQSPITKKCTQ